MDTDEDHHEREDPEGRAPEIEEDSEIVVECSFVRGRNVLAVRGAFGPIYTDWYLHLMQHGLRVAAGDDRIFKQAIAAFTLYLASRPWKEVTAWTANIQDPLLNVFVTGNSLAGTVTGRIFTENIREQAQSLLYSTVRPPDEEQRQSIVEIEGNDFFAITEDFHRQSDQRAARFFELRPEEHLLLAAQPQADLDWLEDLSLEEARHLDEIEETRVLERRRFRFHCGCSLARIGPALAPLTDQDLDDLFAVKTTIEVTCPRCGAIFHVARAEIEQVRDRSQGE